MIYYIYNGSELLGFVYKNKTYYYHKNMFGDIISILDSSYNEIVTYKYDSWGALVNITDSSNINLGTINPFRYRSYYYDNETSLYYLNSRYYNPQVGRFINGDICINSNYDFISENIFVYTSNNYINYKDIDGYSITSILSKVKSFATKIVNTVKSIIKKVVYRPKVCKALSDTNQGCRVDIGQSNRTDYNLQQSGNINRKPDFGDPGKIYDMPNGDMRKMEPWGDRRESRDFDFSHPWHHNNLTGDFHVHDYDADGNHLPAREPTPDEIDEVNRHKKEIGNAIIVGVGTVGVGYLIYRGIRLLPSLTPWTWWSIPYNLATP